jgi:hypothetical protein
VPAGGRIEVHLVQRLQRAVDEELATRRFALGDRPWAPVPDLAVERDQISPRVRIGVPNPSETRIS